MVSQHPNNLFRFALDRKKRRAGGGGAGEGGGGESARVKLERRKSMKKKKITGFVIVIGEEAKYIERWRKEKKN